MFNRINFLKIIKDHFATLNNINVPNGKITMWDFLTFIILPAIISAYFCVLNLDINTYLSNIITAVAIFGGFLFNLLAIIYGLMDKLQADANGSPADSLKRIFVKQIHINISFNILLSIFLTVFLIVYPYVICKLNVIDIVFQFLIYYCLILFLLTLLMILNRVYILLKRDI